MDTWLTVLKRVEMPSANDPACRVPPKEENEARGRFPVVRFVDELDTTRIDPRMTPGASSRIPSLSQQLTGVSRTRRDFLSSESGKKDRTAGPDRRTGERENGVKKRQ